jgi:myosin protein heavy chain
MSWLNNTVADPTVAPFLSEIARLQRDLDRANESIDDKLDRLGEAGLGVVNLTKKLDDARSRIVALEEDIGRLSRREDRRVRRLERARCIKCHGRVDLRGLNRAAEGDERSDCFLASAGNIDSFLRKFCGHFTITDSS